MKNYFLQYGTWENAFENWTRKYSNLDEAIDALVESILEDGITDSPYETEADENDYDDEWKQWVKEEVKKNGCFLIEEEFDGSGYEVVIGITDKKHYDEIADLLAEKREEWFEESGLTEDDEEA